MLLGVRIESAEKDPPKGARDQLFSAAIEKGVLKWALDHAAAAICNNSPKI